MQNEIKITNIDINNLMPNPYQPRKNFDSSSINDLAKSIKEYGILNPILVRPKGDKFEIIAGERRVMAAKTIGLTTIPAIIKELDDQKMAELSLVENLHRENLNPIDEARSYKELLNSTNITEQELGDKIGKSKLAVANKTQLLTLPKIIQDAVMNKKISERHARTLMSVKDEEEQQQLLDRIINEKLTVKELESTINQQATTEEELQNAIAEIMQSLKETKEEEKESDKMNEGSFFPNFNNNMPPQGDMSLNSMNMQSMQPQINPAPAPEPIPNQNFGAMNNNFQNNMNNFTPVQPDLNNVQAPLGGMEAPAPMPEMPLFGQPVEPVPQPEMTQPNPEPLFNLQPASEPIVAAPVQPDLSAVQAPLGGMEAPAPMPEIPQSEQPMDMPLFNQNLTEPQNNEFNPVEIAPAATFDIPVLSNAPQPAEVAEVDKLEKTKSLLDSNGIEYKLYSNETGHCIIIEL